MPPLASDAFPDSLPLKVKPPDLAPLDADELPNVIRLCCAFCVALSVCGCELPKMPPRNPPELGPFTVFVLLKVNPGAALKFGDADLLVEASVDVLTEVVVDMDVMAEVVALGSVLEAAILTAGFKPPTAAAFSFMSFEKSNLKPPGELAVVLLVTVLN